MPASDAEIYFPVLLQFFIAMAVAAGMLGASYLLGKKVRSRVKDMPYECGMVPTGDVGRNPRHVTPLTCDCPVAPVTRPPCCSADCSRIISSIVGSTIG